MMPIWNRIQDHDVLHWELFEAEEPAFIVSAVQYLKISEERAIWRAWHLTMSAIQYINCGS
jgi:hypothetical protein